MNTYYPGTAAGATAGSTSIPVGARDARGSATVISAGDLLLVVQMQDASIDVSNSGAYGDGSAGDPATGATGGTGGLYEYVVATGAISAGAVPIGSGLINSYAFAASSATHGQTRYQVIRVPQYANATLTGNINSPTWNGTTGGIVAIDVAGVLNFGGFSINVSGRGFRGGQGRAFGGSAGVLAADYRILSSLNAFGLKGEGIAGTPQFTYSAVDGAVDNGAGIGYPDGASAIASSGRGAPANAGGGANDSRPSANDENAGGGGGGNGGGGGKGGRTWNNVVDIGGFGGSFASPSSARLVMGGGGGAGSRNNSSGVMSSGGAGGGIVMVRAGSITGNGSINADGGFGVEPSNDGGGGGGAGGSVIVVSPAALPATLGISARGANGTNAFAASAPGTAGEFTVGSANNRHGPGGGGGGGVVYLSGSGPSLNVGGGAGGTTTTAVNGFGATPGNPGVSGTISMASIPGTPAGASCSADVSVTKTGPATFTAGTNGSYTIQVTNSGPAAASAVSIADPTPPGLTFVSASAPCAGGFPCALGTLASGATTSITVTYQIPAGYAGSGITNTATVSSTTPDPTVTNNTSTVLTPSATSANLNVTKSGPGTIAAGTSGSFTITITNNGPSNATGVSLSDPTPAGLTFVSATAPCAGGVSPCAIGTINAGASVSVTVTYSVPAGYAGPSPFTNTATVSATTSDPDGSDDTVSVQTIVGTPRADLAVVKSGPSFITSGSQITYTITVTNNGPSPADAVSLTDPAPAGLSFTSLSGACTGTFPCALGTMAAGAAATVTAVYSIPPGYSGANPIVNTATVSSTTTDPTNGNNSSSVSSSVSASADVQVTKSGPAAVNPGDLINYTITLMNNGPSHAASVYLDDPIPLGLVFVSSSAPCAGGFVSPCSLGTVNAGSSVTITVVYSVPLAFAGSSVTNTATTTHSTPDPNAANNSGSATTAIGTADLQVTKSGPASINPGQQISYTLAVQNNGPSAAAGVVLSDATPTGLTFVSASAPCGGGFPCSIGGILSGATTTITAVYQVPVSYSGPNPIANTAGVTSTSADPNAANDSSTTTSAVLAGSADLAVTKSGPASVIPGQQITYTISVANNGPSDATGVSLADPTPAGLTFVSASAPCAGFPCALGTIAAGSTTTITAVFQVPPTYSGSGPITNTATATATTSDPNGSNDQSTVSTSVIAADLAVTKTISPSASPAVGSTITYTVTITNNGPATATNVAVTDNVPAGLTSVVATPGGGTTYSSGTGVWTVGSLANGASATLSIQATVNAPGTVVNTATITASDQVDPNGANNSASVSFTTINSAPVATDDTYTVIEDGSLNVAAPGVRVNDSDADSDPLTAILLISPLHGTLTFNSNGSFVYTPNVDYNGPDSFTYKVNDGIADSNIATVSITVTPVNDPPIAVKDSYSTIEDTPIAIAAPGVLSNDTDIDGGALTVVLVAPPSNGTAGLNPDGSFTYTPNANFTGTDTFTYTANDGTVDSNIATVTITINPVNDPPVAINDAYTTAEDTPLTLAAPGVLANDTDPDGNPLTVTLVGAPSNGAITLNPNGSFTYTPNANYNGTDTFTYKANDGTVDSNVATVTIAINPVNDPPVAVDDAYTTAEDTPLTIGAPGVLANDSDPEGNLFITGTLVGAPSNGIVTLNADGSFTYTPNANYNGTDTFTYKANDGSLDSNIATVTITITPVNDPPVAVNDAYTTAEDTPLTVSAAGVLVNDTDIDGNPLTATLVSSPSNGSAILSPDGSFTYTPNANYSGTDTFTYRANDGTVDSNIATVTITITPANDPPVAVNDAYTTAEDTPLTIAAPGVLANDTDPDGNPLTVILVGAPSNGA
ncbi:MAG: Ig-like domain-containing protein, partial [Thermoanaerobaculia bacterium]